MRVTQDLNSFGEIIAHAQCSVDEKIYIYIPCVPHKNNCPKKIGSYDMKQIDSSIVIVRNVCVLTSASMIVYQHNTTQHNRKLISLHNNGEDDKHAHGFADF